MKGDEKYQLGKLTSDMGAVKADIAEMKIDQKESAKEFKDGQKEILKRIESLRAVSVKDWQARNKWVDERFAGHELRLDALEQRQEIDRHSISYKVKMFMEKELVKVVGLAMVGVILASVFYYVGQANEYQEMVKKQSQLKQ